MVSGQVLVVAGAFALLLLFDSCSATPLPNTPSGPTGGGAPGLTVGGSASACTVLTSPLGVTVTPTLTVTEVVPALPAGRAVLRPGDVLLSIDGIPLTDIDEARRALDQEAIRRAGPCNDVVSSAVDPRTGRVVAISTAIPTPPPGPGVAVSLRRDGVELTVHVDLRWPDLRNGETTPPARGTAYTL